MERLIGRWGENGKQYNCVEACKETCKNNGNPSCYCAPIMEIRKRLASYEDTGLMPEEIQSLQVERNSLDFQNECLVSSVESLNKTVSILQAELERVKAERDSLLGNIQKGCSNCKHWRPKTNQVCVEPTGKPCNLKTREAWEWRGLEVK